MRFSIVVPTFNSQEYLSECLRSIIDQSIGIDLEILVMDGGSTDKTLEIARSFRGVIVDSRKDKGEPDAINRGFDMATGDILAWLDSDDIYTSSCLSEVNATFQNPTVLWAYGKCKVIDGQGKTVRPMVTWAKEILQPRYSYSKLLMVDFIPQPSTFIHRALWKQVGAVDVNEKYVFDYDYWLRCGKVIAPEYMDSYLSCWRAHKGSISVKGANAEADDALRIQRKYGGRGPVQSLVNVATKVLYGLG